MNAQEMGTCNFCRKETTVLRQYLHAKNTPSIGNGFEIVWYCNDCGLLEEVKTPKKICTCKEGMDCYRCPTEHDPTCIGCEAVNEEKPLEERSWDWQSEFREYFDKTLKPKKPTIKNLDRELLVDFMNKIERRARLSEREKVEERFCGEMHIIREEAGKNQLLLLSKIMKAFKRSLSIPNELPHD